MDTIIYPPTIDYRWLYQRPQQMMRALARQGFRTIFCNNDAYFREKPYFKEVETNFFICNRIDPRQIDLVKNPILWVSYPPHAALIGKYGEKLLVFDAIDEPAEEFEHWNQKIPIFQKEADIIFATADTLYQHHRQVHSNVHLCPNGADYSHFAKADADVPPLLPDMPCDGLPIVGYYGAVATWIDWDLVKFLVDAHPEYSFVFIGPLYGLESFPLKGKNIHFLDRKEYEVLPTYLSHFSACIIPFKLSRMIQGCNPIKMYEYFSAGKPVVATAMPELIKCREALIGRNPKEFSFQLRKAVEEDSKASKERRKAFARENSWDARASLAARVIRETLARKYPVRQANRRHPHIDKAAVTKGIMGNKSQEEKHHE